MFKFEADQRWILSSLLCNLNSSKMSLTILRKLLRSMKHESNMWPICTTSCIFLFYIKIFYAACFEFDFKCYQVLLTAKNEINEIHNVSSKTSQIIIYLTMWQLNNYKWIDSAVPIRNSSLALNSADLEAIQRKFYNTISSPQKIVKFVTDNR